MNICTVDGCNKPKVTKNAKWCSMHNTRWARTGKLDRDGEFMSVSDRIEAKIERITESGCWVWVGALAGSSASYPVAKTDGERYVHRYMYEKHTGKKIPKGIDVCHRCDVPSCVNPNHLFVGTRKDNMADMKQKGRSSKGEKRYCAKLTYQKVSEIKERYAAGGVFYKDLAEECGVSESAVGQAIRGETWVK